MTTRKTLTWTDKLMLEWLMDAGLEGGTSFEAANDLMASHPETFRGVDIPRAMRRLHENGYINRLDYRRGRDSPDTGRMSYVYISPEYGDDEAPFQRKSEKILCPICDGEFDMYKGQQEGRYREYTGDWV